MGVCFSCVKSDLDDQGYDERTSLLNDSRFGDEDFQNELLRQQKRQNELSTIVNNLNENLIDVYTFLSPSSSQNRGSAPQMTENFSAEDDFEQPSPAQPSAGLEIREKQFPKIWTLEEKKQLLQQVAEENVKYDIKAPEEPLYVDL